MANRMDQGGRPKLGSTGPPTGLGLVFNFPANGSLQIGQDLVINHTQWLAVLEHSHLHLGVVERGHADQGADYVLDGRCLVGNGQNLVRVLLHVIADRLA